ncbi:8033_t:CDS:1, partial [Racocetra persica]
ITKFEYFVSNKAKLCRSHLRNCLNFKDQYAADEVLEIIACLVPEDAKKKTSK